ncbi:hypothetical protein [Streptomyces sp. NPDC006309]
MPAAQLRDKPVVTQNDLFEKLVVTQNDLFELPVRPNPQSGTERA